MGLFISSAGRLLPAGEPENRCQPSDAPWLRLNEFACPALRCPSILRFCAAAPVFSFVKLPRDPEPLIARNCPLRVIASFTCDACEENGSVRGAGAVLE